MLQLAIQLHLLLMQSELRAAAADLVTTTTSPASTPLSSSLNVSTSITATATATTSATSGASGAPADAAHLVNDTSLVVVWRCRDLDQLPPPDPNTEHLVICPSVFIIAFFTGLLAVVTVVGNLMVIMAVVLNAKLSRKGTSILIVNLAIADLLVGTVVMPLGVSTIITGSKWIYGRLMCRVWISLDVICCSASIITLCVISVDRYIGVTKPLQYAMLVTRRRVVATCFVVWLASALVLLCTLRWTSASVDIHECFVGNELRYVAHSTIFSFFIPLFVILAVYYKIFQVTRNREMSLAQCAREAVAAAKQQSLRQLTHSPTSDSMSPSHTSAVHMVPITNKNGASSLNFLPLRIHYGGSSTAGTQVGTQKELHKERKWYRKQKKSAKTLGIIVGAFIICWTPFFCLYIINSYFGENIIPGTVLDFCTWLGYINSTLNPLIYGMTMRTFKDTFTFLLSRKRFLNWPSTTKRMLNRESIRWSIRRMHAEEQDGAVNKSRRSQEIKSRKRRTRSTSSGSRNLSGSSTDSGEEPESSSFLTNSIQHADKVHTADKVITKKGGYYLTHQRPSTSTSSAAYRSIESDGTFTYANAGARLAALQPYRSPASTENNHRDVIIVDKPVIVGTRKLSSIENPAAEKAPPPRRKNKKNISASETDSDEDDSDEIKVLTVTGKRLSKCLVLYNRSMTVDHHSPPSPSMTTTTTRNSPPKSFLNRIRRKSAAPALTQPMAVEEEDEKPARQDSVTEAVTLVNGQLVNNGAAAATTTTTRPTATTTTTTPTATKTTPPTTQGHIRRKRHGRASEQHRKRSTTAPNFPNSASWMNLKLYKMLISEQATAL